ncbi:3-isopropylmalate dehydratase [Stutzerimonas nosocomialis]|uniref:3-isopropylmalate dehydratase n=1 Tax=Stutzerimonas nosocomialis TaxID=1056496 RepID=A0A5R9QWR0_9GAMM|nr:3-isopropylmalate dehydratase [Stutzerimonas nosocomialis]TLX53660.1 3-isopropylmalate dehydratase [Stutzerimonas nosocomialis]TLX63545.1 3-isopropylmalate dehydratase [Stutzerimonas nosocomialis]
MRPMLCLFPLLALAGCSSYTPDEISPVPEERLLGYQQNVPGGGEVLVQRDVGMLGGGCNVAFLIDRRVAARIGIGEYARFEVPAGTRIVGIGIDEEGPGLCSKGRLNRERVAQVGAGATLRFRIVSEAKSGFDIRPLD